MKRLVILVGPGGSGKSTLENNLVKHYGYRKSISVTTREPREGEVDGHDYHFITKEEFLERPDFLESVEFNGEYYGTVAEDLFKDDKDVVAVLTPHGALQLNSYVMFNLFTTVQMILVYMNISLPECGANMEKRGDSEEEIEKRLKNETTPQLFIASHLRADIVLKELGGNTHNLVGDELNRMKFDIKYEDAQNESGIITGT